MSDYNLGTARGVIEITTNTSGIKDANAEISKVGRNAEKQAMTTKQAFSKVSTGMMVAGGVVAGGLAIATKTAMDFEKRLSGIAAVSGETEAGMQKIRDKALQIGKDTKFSAGEAATAIEELAKAGVSSADILNGAADATVALAAAGEVDLPFAAAVASNAMNQFNLTAKDMVGVTDSIAGAANASAIDVNDFGQALAQVGAVANLAGLNFDDTAVAIAEMGNAGIKGSDAGTSLKSMLMRLQPQTKAQVAAMRELGILTKDGSNQFYDQEGRLKSLSDIQSILSTSLKGMTKEQKQATLQTLFGSDAIRAASVLANEGAAGYDKMAKAIGKTSAADVAAKRMDNLAGSWEQLKGSLETLAIQLGSVLLPVLKQITDAVTSVVNAFVALPDGVKQAIVIAAAAAAAFLLVGGAIIKIVQFAQGLVAAIRAISAAMMLLNANPIFLIITAVIALVAAIIWLWNNNETFRNIVTAVWNKIYAIIEKVVTWFRDTVWPIFQAAFENIKTGLQGMGDFFKSVWDGIYAVVEWVVNAIKAYIEFYFNLYKTIITTAINVIKTVWTAVWNGIKAVVQFILDAIKAYITAWITVVTAIWNGIRRAYEIVRDAFQRAYDAIREKLNSALEFIRGIPGKILGILSGLGRLLWDAGARIMGGFLDGIKAGFKPIQDFVGGIAGWIADHKGPKQKDMKLLVSNGKWIMKGLDQGLNKEFKSVQKNVKGMGTGLSKALNSGVKGSDGAAIGAQLSVGGSGYNPKLLAQEATLQKLVDIASNMNITQDAVGVGKGKGGKGSASGGSGAGGTGVSGKGGSGTTGSGRGSRENWTDPLLVTRGQQAQASRLAAQAAAIAREQVAKMPSAYSAANPPPGYLPDTAASDTALRRAAQQRREQARRAANMPNAYGPDSGIYPAGSIPVPHGAAGTTVNVTVNNPRPEPAGESLTRAAQRVAYLGLG